MSEQLTMEERLWEYIDGMSTPEEKTVIDQLIEANAEWRAKYGELLEVHQLMFSSELEEPSMRFTKNLMEEIAVQKIAPAAKSYINKKIIWGIAIFFITIIVGFLIYGIGQVKWSSGAGSDETKIPVDFSKIDLSPMFNNTYINIFMMLNVVLGLFLFDRYLASKRKERHHEA
jgi:regulatory protein YycI of two-component signal transduction system YycFG